MKISLINAIEKDGQTINELTLNLKGLTGNDLTKAESDARAMGDTSPDPLFSAKGLTVIAAKAAGMIPDDILGLSAPDFLQVKAVVSIFLYGWLLPAKTQSEIYGEQS
ncbi:MAG: hypothetical protein A4E53_01167 [Pelotomaculum sp. PtaB.Bin104]|nr:MAG: hypothetical protein A4E53_01167 [Pelotomaculum sp. PtaB.Bin104]